MRILAVLFTLALVPLAAHAGDPPTPQEHHRLRVGLVLSGGGARGAAHIGVLRVLERMHIPVDAIAGTSMGAVVGGLYSTGMSATDIENTVNSIDWADAFHDRPPRSEQSFRHKAEQLQFPVNFPIGIRGRKLLIPKGLLQGQKLTSILRRLTLPVAGISSFDQLPTPFRDVATDLETGEAVVFSDGDLTTTMRASMSAPGVFTPVNYRGRTLVDGGLVDNLPVTVARAMGVDVLIVVSADLPLLPKKQLSTLPGITNQMITILLHQGVQKQLQSLQPGDIQVKPQLGEYSSFDFANMPRVIGAGAAAAALVADRLAPLAVSEAEYADYVRKREALREPLPRLDFLTTDDHSVRYRRQLLHFFGHYLGKPMDPDALGRSESLMYGQHDLELLDYRLESNPAGQKGLNFTAARESWGPNYLHFDLQLQDDFEGNTIFNAGARLDLTEINSLGAEWNSTAQIGTSPQIGTEFYEPLAARWPLFVAPHALVEAHDLIQVGTKGDPIGTIRVRSSNVGFDVGSEIGNWGETRIGVARSDGAEHIDLGSFPLNSTSFGVDRFYASLAIDTLDRVNFPRAGQAFTANLSYEHTPKDQNASNQFSADWRGAHSWGRNTLVGWASYGTTFSGSQNNPRDFYTLGGFLNLSGVRAQTLSGPQYAIGRLIYLRQVGSGGEGVLNVPGYIGLSLESGNVWAAHDKAFGPTHKDIALFFAADTYLGPLSLSAGYDESGSVALYLFLGRSL